MRAILEKIYEDYLSSGKQEIIRNSEYADVVAILADTGERIVKEFEDSTLLTAFTDAQGRLSLISEIEAFINGFRMGARLMIEAFGENDGNLKGITDKAEQ